MHALHRQMKLPQGMKLEAEDEGEDEDENELPDHVTVFFAIGFAIMALFAVVFLNLALSFNGPGSRQHGPMMHFLAFFVASISVFTYFSMWANTGVMHVEYVGEAEESRVLFPAWYLDWAITIPTILVAIGMVGSWAISSIVITCGSALMMLGTLWFGAATEGAYRYVFFAGGAFFYGLLAFLLFIEVSRGRKVGAQEAGLHAASCYLAIASWGSIPVLWLVGECGTRAASVEVEVVVTAAADVLGKALILLLLVAASTAAQPPPAPSTPSASPAKPPRQITSSTYV